MSEYKPVACEMHSLYELAVMHHTAALVRWRHDGSVREARLLPLDVETRNREEFLIAETAEHETVHIRLDRILDFSPER